MKKLFYLAGAALIFLASCKPEPAEIDACISSDKDTILVGEVVQFTNCTEDYLTKEWDFGDGGNTTISNPTHKFEDAGEFTVTLSVTNVDGSSDVMTKTIVVNELKLISVEVEDFDFTNDWAFIDISLNGTYISQFDYNSFEYTNPPYIDEVSFGSIKTLTYKDSRTVSTDGFEFMVEKDIYDSQTFALTEEDAYFIIDPLNDLDFTKSKLELEVSDSGTGTTVTFNFELDH